MNRLATRDRRGPGQLVSVAIAVAATVAVAVTAFASLAVESNAVASQTLSGLSKAGLVATVTGAPADGQPTATAAQVEDALRVMDGVSSAHHNLAAYTSVFAGGSATPAVMMETPNEALAWATLAEGSWPKNGAEIVLSQSIADALDTGVGSTVTISASSSAAAIVGISNDLPTVRGGVAYTTRQWFATIYGIDDPVGDYALLLDPDAEPAAVAANIRSSFSLGYPLEVRSPSEVVAQEANRTPSELTTWRNLAWIVAGLAVVAGAAWIATAITSVLAQRRRQFGLLRALGASESQLRRPVLVDAAKAGLLGAAAGVVVGVGLSWLIATLTNSIRWGVAVPWIPVAVAFAVGALLPVLVGYVLVLRASRVAPLTALGLAPQRRRWRVPGAAWLVAGIALIGGMALLVWAFASPSWNTASLRAVGGVALLIVAFLFASRAIIPALVRMACAIVGRFGVAGRLAAGHLTRTPRHTTAATTALALVVGLVVLLQSGMAVVRNQVLDQVYAKDAVAIAVTAAPANDAVVPIPNSIRIKLEKTPGITAAIALNGVAVPDDKGFTWVVLSTTAEAIDLTAKGAAVPIPEQAFINPASWPSDAKTISLNLETGPRVLAVELSELAEPGQVVVRSDTFAGFGAPTQSAALWLAVPDRSMAGSLATTVADIVGDDPRLAVSGSVYTAGGMANALAVLDGVAIGLSVVAVFIALIGIGSALRLAGDGRRREQAVLRTLGLPPGGLRSIVSLEALTVAAVATVAGIVAGWVLAWIGTLAALRDATTIVTVVTSNWLWPAGLLVATLAAALVAAIGPGRRAARVPQD